MGNGNLRTLSQVGNGGLRLVRIGLPSNRAELSNYR